ncbi:Hsp70 family protein, partial [Simkania negevensis]|nr:Hsp70 family protein [Simkania negevensis]
MSKSKYLIGIDLGTTNSTMSYAKIGEDEASSLPEISLFPIPQMVRSGSQEERKTMPSSLYYPLKEELEAGSFAVDWASDREFCVGSAASERGGELPSRLVTSAKSWLCHSGIDRRSSLLPYTAGEDDPRTSPLAVTAELLRHLREVWNLRFPDAPFVDQSLLITVPASFDPSARQLTQEAALLAGYPEEVVLMEEPQAAFYAWLYHNPDEWRTHLAVGDRLLVVDIGGGTTDFTLINVEEEGGDLSLTRMAVGSHLLL